MNREDQKLDELLRSVEVPSELHSRLHTLLQEQVTAHNSERHVQPSLSTNRDPNQPKLKSFRYRTWWGIAAAASLLAAMSGPLLWKMTFPPNVNSLIAESSSAASSTTITLEGSDLSSVEELDQQIAAQQAVVCDLENTEIERQIKLAEQELVKLRSKPRLNDLSVTLTAVAESALKGGVSARIVREDLEFVIDRFPESSGAKMAHQILANLD